MLKKPGQEEVAIHPDAVLLEALVFQPAVIQPRKHLIHREMVVWAVLGPS